MNRVILLLIYFALQCNVIYAQSVIDIALKNRDRVSVQTWNEVTGLQSNSVSDLLISSQGFLWIGTEFGLSRFDGFEIKNYNILNTPEIKANKISEFFEDRKGILWFSNSTAGVVNYKDGVFRRFEIENGLPENNTSGIVEDKNGTVWIGTRGGGLASIKNGAVEVRNIKNGFPTDRVTSVAKSNNDGIWLGTNNKGVIKLSNDKATIYDERLGLLNKFIYKIFVDSRNRVWVIYFEGASLIENDKVTVPEYLRPFQKTPITSITEDNFGRVCITTPTSAFVLINNTFQEFFSVENKTDIHLLKIYVNKEDVWFGTKESGVFRLRANKVQNISTKNGLPGSSASLVFQDSQNRTWIGSSKKLVLYDLKKYIPIKIYDQLNSDILFLTEVNPNKMLIGTRTSGIWELSNSILKKIAAKDELGANIIRSLFYDESGKLYVGTNGNGLAIIQNNNFAFLNKDNGLSSNLISCMSQDNKGRLWIGTTGGGINLLSSDKRIKVINKAKGLPHNNVTSIIHDGELTWVATNGGGICLFNKEVIKKFTIDDGLYDNRIFNMADDGNGRLWLSTKKGIFTISKSHIEEYSNGKLEKLNYKLFTESDGMLSDECETLTMQTILVKKAEILVATTAGISAINFDNLKYKEEVPRIFIDELKIDSKKVNLNSSLQFPPGTTNIEINYSGVSFDHGKNLIFSYMLEGMDSKWIKVGARRAAYFTHLSPGNYRFIVKAETPQGTLSVNPAVVSFYVEPYLYQRLWFQLSMLFLLIGVVTGAVRFVSLKNLRLKLEKIEAQAGLERERMRISKDMHDELGAELTKIGLLSEIAKSNFRNNKDVVSDLNRVIDASRDVAITMDEIVWAVNPKNDRLDKLCNYLAGYINEYISLSEIKLIVRIPEFLPEEFISAEFRHNIFLVIKESLNNVVKHSYSTEVVFEIEFSGNTLRFILIDNGKGISNITDEFSNGIENMKKRMVDIGGSFELIKNEPKGTVAKISVTVNESH